MSKQIRIATVAAHFGPDVEKCLRHTRKTVADAQAEGIDLLVLPHGTLGGYHDHLGTADAPRSDLPPAVDLDGPELAALIQCVGAMTLVLGITERIDGGIEPADLDAAAHDSGIKGRANTAVCLDSSGIRGVHRKVHLPRGEELEYTPGEVIAAFDTRVGRIGMLVDYDKTFPEAARCLALDGAQLIANPCAWPASRTQVASSVRDRQRLMFDTYDAARAAENQVVFVSANQTGRHGILQFFGSSKIVLPDGSSAAFSGDRPGMVAADIDIRSAVANARQVFDHLRERQPDRYGPLSTEPDTA